MIKFILVLFISLTFYACLDIETRSDIRILKKIINNSDRALLKQGFKRIGYGGKWYPTIKTVYMSYFTCIYRFQTVDEVRKFFVPIFEDYILPLNEEKSIRPFLSNYPLDATNLELSISFYDDNNNRLPEPWICSVRTIDGNIKYLIKTPNLGYATVLYSEPYEEAKRIVLQSK